jgi:hypothetical protein
MSNNNATSSSHAMLAHRTMFVKPGMFTQYTSSMNRGKRYNYIPTCHYCGIIGHTRPNCFQIPLRSHGLKSMYLGIMSPVLEIRSIIYVIK